MKYFKWKTERSEMQNDLMEYNVTYSISTVYVTKRRVTRCRNTSNITCKLI